MRLSPYPLDHHSSFLSSLNSIDENKSTDETDKSTFAKKHCPDVYSNVLQGKRQSDPAIQFSFYNKLFDVNDSSQGLLSPERDFRKFSLPSSMTSLRDQPDPSLTFDTWKNFNKMRGKKITRSRSQDIQKKFQWTLNDEPGNEMNSQTLSPSSQMEDFIDEQCLHFEENFVNIDDFETKFFDSFDRKFDDENFFQRSTESITSNENICQKCGHDILRL